MAKCVELSEIDNFYEYIDGQVLSLTSGDKFYIVCCDCGLAHKVDITSHANKEIRIQLFIDDKKTTKARRC